MDDNSQRSTTAQIDWRGLWLIPLIAALLGGLCWYQHQEQTRAAVAEAAKVAAAAAQSYAVGPAPTVRKGKPVVIKGKKMSTWIVSGAGTSAYNGTYVESGTYDGKAAYTDGTRWLYWATDKWWLSTAKGDMEPAAAYYGTGADLPANAWTANTGTAPAPTVAEDAGTPGNSDPYKFPYPNWWGPSLSASPIAPGLVTVGGVDYIAFCRPAATTSSLVLFNLTDHAWYLRDTVAAPLASYDAHQGGGLFDAGDGANAWAFSGGYESTGYKFRCSAFNLISGAAGDTDEVALESETITNMVAAGDGTFRFCERQGTTLRLHSYTPGASTYTELAEWAAGAWPGLPVGWTEGTVSLNPDHALWLSSSGDLYYLRAGNYGVLPYRVSAARAERLSDIPGSASSYQTAGEYRDTAVHLSGSSSGPNGEHVRWEPGDSYTREDPYAYWPMGRTWYLTGTSALYVAGWGDGAAANLPFVMVVQPETLTMTGATYALTAHDLSFAHAVPMEHATLALTAHDLSFREVQFASFERAQIALTAHDLTIIGQESRVPAASTTLWYQVRVRAGA